jgi:GAF domain-containing protein
MEESLDVYSALRVRATAFDRCLHLFGDLSNKKRVYDAILDIANEAVPCEAAGLLLVTAEDGEMTFVAATGPVAEKALGIKLAAGMGIAGACVRDRAPIAVSDVQTDPRFAKAISDALGFTTRSLLAVPILFTGGHAGVIELVNREGSDHWRRQDVEIVERIARVTGTLIDLLEERS